jgi:hypothetical protein
VSPRPTGFTSQENLLNRDEEERQMTTAVNKPLLGASSKAVQWSAIHWRATARQVQRLQKRIAKATRENRWGKVNALQWLLTHSFTAKCLAVRRVTPMCRVTGSGQRAFVKLEPCAVKIACTVLRGGNDGNVVPLPDVRHDVVR